MEYKLSLESDFTSSQTSYLSGVIAAAEVSVTVDVVAACAIYNNLGAQSFNFWTFSTNNDDGTVQLEGAFALVDATLNFCHGINLTPNGEKVYAIVQNPVREL